MKLQQPYEDDGNIIGELLSGNKNAEEAKKMLYKFWKIREKKMKPQ